MAERMVFDDLRKSMGKSLIWAHEPKELRRKSTWKSVKFCPNCGSWARACGQQLGKLRYLGYISRTMIEAT